MSNMSSICDKNHTWGIGRLFGKRLEGYGFKNRGGMRRVCFYALLPPNSRNSRGDAMKYLHTMVRVTDIEQSLRFYRDALGLRELSRKDYPQGRFTLVFLAAPGDEDAQVELTHNWDPEEYSVGRNFGHLAYAVDDIYAACRRLMEHGVTINRPPRDGRMAFVRSPDRVSVELLQKGAALAPAAPWTTMASVGTW